MLIGCCGTTKTYAEIARMGYDYIELSGRKLVSLPEEEFARFLEEYRTVKFPCLSINDYCGGDVPLVGPDYRKSIVRAYTQKLCRRCSQLGARAIGIGAPTARRVSEGYPAQKADADMRECLATICEVAQAYQIRIMLEPINQYRCNYLNYIKDVFEFVHALRIPNLGIAFDYYHSSIMGEQLRDALYAVPYIWHLHISTCLEGRKRGYLKEADVPTMREFAKTALAAGYQGNVSIEAAEESLRQDGAACAAFMRQAIAG